jgi:hypothetical protein
VRRGGGRTGTGKAYNVLKPNERWEVYFGSIEPGESKLVRDARREISKRLRGNKLADSGAQKYFDGDKVTAAERAALRKVFGSARPNGIASDSPRSILNQDRKAQDARLKGASGARGGRGNRSGGGGKGG